VKIAIASDDGISLSSHFGRCRSFLVYDVDGGKITGLEVRTNGFTAFAKGECDGQEVHLHAPHNHADIVEALRDCRVVLCGGMGWRAAEEFQSRGIQPLVVKFPGPAAEAVAAYLAGTLPSVIPFCRCHE
jgi:predicted Fe-Mo cluster-binding NifX family protein